VNISENPYPDGNDIYKGQTKKQGGYFLMEISKLIECNGHNTSTEDLLSYLSQIVLTQTDEKIEQKRRTLDTVKESVSESKDDLKILKERLIRVRSEQRRLDALYKVLKLIDNLKQEGVMIGANKAKISNLLYKVQDQDVKSLIKLKSRLSTYIPDHSKITMS